MICPRDLSVSSLSILLPKTHSTPVTLVLSAAQSHRHDFGSLYSRPAYHRTLLWPSLASLSPSVSFFTTLIMTWYRIFPLSLLCVSLLEGYYFIMCVCVCVCVCILQLFPYLKHYALRTKGYILINISK